MNQGRILVKRRFNAPDVRRGGDGPDKKGAMDQNSGLEFPPPRAIINYGYRLESAEQSEVWSVKSGVNESLRDDFKIAPKALHNFTLNSSLSALMQICCVNPIPM